MTSDPSPAVGVGRPNLFQGMRVIENAALEQDGEPYEVQRAWRERLFSRPWRPFQRTRTIVPRIPYQGVYQIAGAFVMHPAIAQKLRKTLR